MKGNILHYSIIGIFTSLHLLVAKISTVNPVEFFNSIHNSTLSWFLVIRFELGDLKL
jgi:hypothetical protein